MWSWSKKTTHWWGLKLYFTHSNALDFQNFVSKFIITGGIGAAAATALTAIIGPIGVGIGVGVALALIPLKLLEQDLKHYLSSAKNPNKKGLIVEIKWWLYGSKAYLWQVNKMIFNEINWSNFIFIFAIFSALGNIVLLLVVSHFQINSLFQKICAAIVAILVYAILAIILERIIYFIS